MRSWVIVQGLALAQVVPYPAESGRSTSASGRTEKSRPINIKSA